MTIVIIMIILMVKIMISFVSFWWSFVLWSNLSAQGRKTPAKSSTGSANLLHHLKIILFFFTPLNLAFATYVYVSQILPVILITMNKVILNVENFLFSTSKCLTDKFIRFLLFFLTMNCRLFIHCLVILYW